MNIFFFKKDFSFQVSQEQMDKILDLINAGKKAGAKLLVGGQREGDKGFFVQPTLFVDVEDHHPIAREEVRNQCWIFLGIFFFAI
jgi:acyl-CoA reductase-like NAD-dependent aldehyde dehydrogenase